MPAHRVPPSGQQFEIGHGRQRLVAVSAGGAVRSYSAGGVDLLDGFGEDEPPSAGRGVPLQPWPNRVRDGRFTFAGADYQLSLTEPDNRNALHGFAWHTAFDVAHHSSSSVALRAVVLAQPGWPWPLLLETTYTLDDGGLSATVAATNIGTRRAPYGHGVHPYLRPGPGPCDGWTLQISAAKHLVYDDRLIPVGESPVDGTPFDFRQPRPIADAVLNTTFGDLVPGPDGRVRATVADPGTGVALTLWADGNCPWLLAFTGDTLGARARQGVAIEPMTCPPNALASGRDLVILEPGESHVTRWGISPQGIDL